MEKWVLYALISMIFAGFTSVIAKMGLAEISGELGLTIRTLFVFLFVICFAWNSIPAANWLLLNPKNIFWLGLSGATTTLSWIFYYKALKTGDVATVALIDKGSVVIAVLLAWLLLKEAITMRILMGSALIVSGLIVMIKPP